MPVEITLLLKATGLGLAAFYNLILAFEAWPSLWRFGLSIVTSLILGWFAYEQITIALATGGT